MDNLFICDKQLMKNIIATLNDIEVKGKNNMDNLLGVILVLERAMNQPKPETKTETINLDEEEKPSKE